ncbi:MAG: hypothetical protein RLY78_1783 [Pseudomonadota bacterium]|jgi:hypothetical protein
MKAEYDLSKLKLRRNPYGSKLSERPLPAASPGSRIVITPVGSSVKDDRRAELRAAAARVRENFSTEFQQLGAEEIMRFIRGDEPSQDQCFQGGRKIPMKSTT